MFPFTALHLQDEAGRLRALYRYDALDTAQEEGFDELVALARRIMGTPMAAISLIDEDRQWFKAAEGLEAREMPRQIAFCAHTIAEDGPMIVPDASRDSRFCDNPLVTAPDGIRSYLGAPLTTPDGYNIGAICALDGKPRKFSAEDAALLGGLARIAVSMLELRQAARSDALTGTLSRGGFEQVLEAQIAPPAPIGAAPIGADPARDLPPSVALHPARADAARGPGPANTLLILDIDHFKSVNDDFGHLVGDDVLRAVAQAIRSSLREGDTLGRLGGEEFGILLCATDARRGAAVAERVRTAISRLILPELAGRQITASLGLAQHQPGWQSRDWIGAADAALYAAKHGGRNRVEVAPAQPAPLQTESLPPDPLNSKEPQEWCDKAS